MSTSAQIARNAPTGRAAVAPMRAGLPIPRRFLSVVRSIR